MGLVLNIIDCDGLVHLILILAGSKSSAPREIREREPRPPAPPAPPQHMEAIVNNEEQAKEYFQHYFRLLASRAGVKWDSDNDAEIAAAVEYVIAAAVDRVRATISKAEARP